VIEPAVVIIALIEDSVAVESQQHGPLSPVRAAHLDGTDHSLGSRGNLGELVLSDHRPAAAIRLRREET